MRSPGMWNTLGANRALCHVVTCAAQSRLPGRDPYLARYSYPRFPPVRYPSRVRIPVRKATICSGSGVPRARIPIVQTQVACFYCGRRKMDKAGMG